LIFLAGFIFKSGSNKSFQVLGQMQVLVNAFGIISDPKAVCVTDDDFDS
jgi:hypothetical protein